jgi:hypothetical protein
MNTRAVLLSWAVIPLSVLACAASAFLLLHWWDLPPDAGRGEANHVLAGRQPGLSSAPRQDLAAYRAEKERQLHTFGWVDRQRGIARIPIADAMELLAAGGAR